MRSMAPIRFSSRFALCTLIAYALSSTSARALDFVAELAPCQVVPNGGTHPCGASSARGRASLALSEDESTLAYEITLEGLSLLNDVTAIHLHTASAGENGPHALNIFGLPARDDADLTIDFVTSTLSGVYDDADENFAAVGPPGQRDPGDSVALSSVLGDLLAGRFYVAVHTRAFDLPATAELRGQILPIPEPTTALLLAFALGGLAVCGRGSE